MLLTHLGLLPSRIFWIALPFFMWQAVADASISLPDTGAILLEVVLWGSWFIGLLAILTPSAVSLTSIRMIAPAAIGVGGITVTTQSVSNASLLACGAALLTTALVFLPSFGDPMINGSAYGPERRMALRPPTSMMFALPLIWTAMFFVIASGILLFANERWLFGTLVMLLSVGLGFLSFNVFHQFSRRWLVFVPAGFVLHDYLQLLDAVLFQRKNTLGFGPATVETAAQPSTVDFSRNTFGLALAAQTKEDVELTVRNRKQNKNVITNTVIITPTLPGKVIREAQIRGIK